MKKSSVSDKYLPIVLVKIDWRFDSNAFNENVKARKQFRFERIINTVLKFLAGYVTSIDVIFFSRNVKIIETNSCFCD